jgi:hypothetical protein
MRTSTIVGFLLIVLGLAALAYPRLSYTKREKVLDLGPIQATAETRETVPISPIVGGIAVVAGIVVILAGNKRSV